MVSTESYNFDLQYFAEDDVDESGDDNTGSDTDYDDTDDTSGEEGADDNLSPDEEAEALQSANKLELLEGKVQELESIALDDRGVPWKNKVAELNSKIQAIEEERNQPNHDPGDPYGNTGLTWGEVEELSEPILKKVGKTVQDSERRMLSMQADIHLGQEEDRLRQSSQWSELLEDDMISKDFKAELDDLAVNQAFKKGAAEAALERVIGKHYSRLREKERKTAFRKGKQRREAVGEEPWPTSSGSGYREGKGKVSREDRQIANAAEVTPDLGRKIRKLKEKFTKEASEKTDNLRRVR